VEQRGEVSAIFRGRNPTTTNDDDFAAEMGGEELNLGWEKGGGGLYDLVQEITVKKKRGRGFFHRGSIFSIILS